MVYRKTDITTNENFLLCHYSFSYRKLFFISGLAFVFLKALIKHNESAVRVIFLIFITLLLLITTEFGARLLLPVSRSPIEAKFLERPNRIQKPYVMFGEKEYSVFYGKKLNAMGYRGKAPSKIKKPDEFRIFMLGGSTVFLGEPTISDLLEKMLRKDSSENVNVYNYGVMCSVSGMELARITFEISDYSPDIIIIYNGGNDIINPLLWDPRPGYPMNFIVGENNPLLQRDINSYQAFPLLLFGSKFLRYYFQDFFYRRFIPLEQLRKQVNYGSSIWKQEIVQKYLNNMKKAQLISKGFNSDFFAFFQPLIYYKDSLTTEEKKNVENEHKKYFLEMKQKISTGIKEINQEGNMNIVNLSDIFKYASDPVFKDIIHIRQEYKEVIAKEIFKSVVSVKYLK